MSKTNAKEEFLEHVTHNRVVKAAHIQIRQNDIVELKVGYSDDDYEQFLDSININYDSGYGGQELFGTIWYVGGTWSERGEYDGSEWWNFCSCPDIPESLKQQGENK